MADEREEERPREIEETGLSNDIWSAGPGHCVLGETTPVTAITLAGKGTDMHITWTK